MRKSYCGDLREEEGSDSKATEVSLVGMETNQPAIFQAFLHLRGLGSGQGRLWEWGPQCGAFLQSPPHSPRSALVVLCAKPGTWKQLVMA